MRPPQEREAEFRDVLADLERRKNTPRQLKPLFSIPKPYMLLTDDEVRAFSEERMRPFAQQDERFGGVSDYCHAFGRLLQSGRNAGTDLAMAHPWGYTGPTAMSTYIPTFKRTRK